MSVDASVSDDQQVAREILRRYVMESGCSLSDLQRRSDVDRSILSRFLAGERCLRMKSASQLYCAIAPHISVVERRDFLKSIGLLPVVLTVGRDWELLGHLISEARQMASGYPTLAHRLLVAGHEVAQQSRWEAAIHLLRQAEEAFGPASSQAARAGVEVAQLYINLGDLEAAGVELSRVEREYAGVMDPETTAHLHTRRGWLDYYLGNLHQATEHFQIVLDIAEECGLEYLEHVRHFLGRAYRDLGAQHRPGKARERWLHLGEGELRRVFDVRTRWGNEIHQAFDLLRLAELKRLQRDQQAARELRDRARQMFGRDRAVLHVDLEEADLALRDGEVRPARIRAERALEGFRDIKYARGMARALYLLGVQAYMEGRMLEAIEYYAASLALFPYRGSPAYPDVWSCLEQAVWEMCARGEYNELRKGLCLLHDRAESRTGPFGELNHLATDRTADLMEVLRRLSGDHGETAKSRER